MYSIVTQSIPKTHSHTQQARYGGLAKFAQVSTPFCTNARLSSHAAMVIFAKLPRKEGSLFTKQGGQFRPKWTWKTTAHR
jgi:hypothetical protein